MSDSEDEILNELISESQEHLSAIEPDFLELENEGANVSADLINRIFRAIHSIKGGASFFGLEKITELAHVMESVLMKVRDGGLSVNAEMVDGLLKGADKLQEMLDSPQESNSYEISEFVAPLQVFLSGNAPSTEQQPAPSQEEDKPEEEPQEQPKAEEKKPTPLPAAKPKDSAAKAASSSKSSSSSATVRVKLELLNNLMNLAGELVLSRNEMKQALGSQLNELCESTNFDSELDRRITNFQDLIVNNVGQVNGNPKNEFKSFFDREVQELKNSLRQTLDFNLLETRTIKNVVQNMDLITTQLQNDIMNTRMQPVSAIFSKFPRIIRDLSRSLNKEIELVLEGQEVELDKTILEALNDPLTHLIRNSADHGVETPEIREAAGKPRQGTVHLKAYHEGGQINIDIVDDGAGIDPEKIQMIAVEKGVITPQEADQLSDRESYFLIFKAGFSTAEKVSDVSGRGVGMDVVRTNIEKLGGSIDIDSTKGQGTTIQLKLPLTLAIVPSLIVSCVDQSFAVPQVNIEEIVRIKASQVSEKVAQVHGKPVLRLRETLLPLVDLREILDMPHNYLDKEGNAQEDHRETPVDRRSEDLLEESEDDLQVAERRQGEDRRQSVESAMQVLVVKVGGNRYGLRVDQLQGNTEIVVKPLSLFVKTCPVYTGSTILGDGSVAMILDVLGISEKANLRFGGDLEKAQDENSRRFESMKNEAQTLLKFQNGTDEVFALNLSMVDRIEKIKAEDLKKVGDKEFLQYEDSSLRVLRMHDFMPIKQPEEFPEDIYVIITKLIKHPMGIVISQVDDILEVFHDIDRSNVTGTGVQGSIVQDGQMIIFIDIYSLFETAEPELYAKESASGDLEKVRVLLAEDTSFFRNVVSDFLVEIGCTTDTAINGQEAWDKLNENEYDILVTDIVMPEMDGIELTKKARGSDRFSQLPIVALTSLKNESDRQRIIASGVDSYQAKLDKDALQAELATLVRTKVRK